MKITEPVADEGIIPPESVSVLGDVHERVNKNKMKRGRF
jgi:hypothetical protein